MILPEKVGRGIDYKVLAETVKANISNVASHCKILEEGPKTINGLKFYKIVTDTKIQGLGFYHFYWLYMKDGYLYQLMTWGVKEQTALEVLRKQASVFCTKFTPAKKD